MGFGGVAVKKNAQALDLLGEGGRRSKTYAILSANNF